jgi:hypothetical protein
MAPVLAQMAAAYRSARAFLRVIPAMPMAWLENCEALPPVAAYGVDRGAQLRARLELPQDERLVLIGFGGIGYQAAQPLPMLPGVRWLVPDDWRAAKQRADLIPFARTGLPFLDLLASCDALVTKVGYGSFVEAAAAGIPVLYLDRPDWPETPVLVDWLQAHTRAAVIAETSLFEAGVAVPLARLWAAPPLPVAGMEGATVAARRLLELLAESTD